MEEIWQAIPRPPMTAGPVVHGVDGLPHVPPARGKMIYTINYTTTVPVRRCLGPVDVDIGRSFARRPSTRLTGFLNWRRRSQQARAHKVQEGHDQGREKREMGPSRPSCLSYGATTIDALAVQTEASGCRVTSDAGTDYPPLQRPGLRKAQEQRVVFGDLVL